MIINLKNGYAIYPINILASILCYCGFINQMSKNNFWFSLLEFACIIVNVLILININFRRLKSYNSDLLINFLERKY